MGCILWKISPPGGFIDIKLMHFVQLNINVCLNFAQATVTVQREAAVAAVVLLPPRGAVVCAAPLAILGNRVHLMPMLLEVGLV